MPPLWSRRLQVSLLWGETLYPAPPNLRGYRSEFLRSITDVIEIPEDVLTVNLRQRNKWRRCETVPGPFAAGRDEETPYLLRARIFLLLTIFTLLSFCTSKLEKPLDKRRVKKIATVICKMGFVIYRHSFLIRSLATCSASNNTARFITP